MKPLFTVENNQESWGIRTESGILAHRLLPQFIDENQQSRTLQCVDSQQNEDGGEWIYEGDGWRMVETITFRDEETLQIHQEWTSKAFGEQKGWMVFDVANLRKAQSYLIPAVSYDGNVFGGGKEPKGLERNGKSWIFSGDRTALPGATFTEDHEYCLGLYSRFTGQAKSDGLACGLRKEGDGMIHHLSWPARELPEVYQRRDRYASPQNTPGSYAPGSQTVRYALLHVGKVSTPRYGWTAAFDRAWPHFRQEKQLDRSAEEVWDLGIAYAKSLIHPKNHLVQIGMRTKGKKDWEPRPFHRYEIGWCGQNASLAVAFMEDAQKRGHQEAFAQGERILDFWCSKAHGKTGLIPVEFDLHPQEPQLAPVADSCNLSWALWWLLRGVDVASKAGISKPLWENTAQNIAQFFVKNFHEEHLFGSKWLVKKGTLAAGGGSIGAFVVSALLVAYEHWKDESMLDVAVRGFWGYVERDLDAMRCGGGALDTGCIDKESGWPLLRAGLQLYELTKEERYLDAAQRAAYFILSWMIHESRVTDEDFEAAGYSPYGGTSVSAQHHHLDPWGALIAGDWLHLSQITGDKAWAERARATWGNAIHGISDGNLVIHDRVRPIGSQNEAYFHCDWRFENQQGRMNDWMVAWPTAFRLVTLMESQDWKNWS